MNTPEKDYSKMTVEELTHEVNVLESEQLNDLAKIGAIKETQRLRYDVISLMKDKIKLLKVLEKPAA